MPFVNPRTCVSNLSLSPGMTVADFGAGTGVFSFCAAEYVGNTGTVYAVDVQKDLLTTLSNEAKERGFKNIHTIWGDIEERGGSHLEDASCDAVICANVLFQVDDKEGVLQEAWHILHAGGKLIIIDWTESHKGFGPKEENVFLEDDARDLAVKNKFTFLEMIPAGNYHYGLVFTKKDE